MATTVSRRYAQAVLSLAKEGNTLDAWQADLKLLADAMADKAVAGFLASPNTPNGSKLQLVDYILANAQPEARNLAHMLVERNRLTIIPDLYETFVAAVLNERGIAVAEVTTAEPLTLPEQQAVRDQLGKIVGKTIELRMRTDPAIIGGIIARVGDQLIDGSVVNQLRALRARLAAPA